AQSDTALYGRVTYEMMQNYWPTAGEKPNATKHDIEHSTWYNKVSKIVLSKTMLETGLHNTKVIGHQLSDNINKLKQREGKNILIFGSPGASQS
ncbi:MAG: dihydrofolate reductase family protein, partial [Candidatus Paceibacterales bacterium]